MSHIFQSIKDSSFVNQFLLPGGNEASYYSPASKLRSHELLWLQNSNGDYFPNLWIPIRNPETHGVLLYCHGNGGSISDFYQMISLYCRRLHVSVFAVEYPGYGPAEGIANEASVNDNVFTAYTYLLSIGVCPANIILMGYSIGTGPVIQLAAELCDKGVLHMPGAVVTVSAFTSIRSLVYDLKAIPLYLNNIAPLFIMERWNSLEEVKKIVCPMMFIHGELDPLIPCKHSHELYRNCSSSDKLFHVCPYADHCNFREPEDTIHPVATFLKAIFVPHVTMPLKIDHSVFQCPLEVLGRDLDRSGQVHLLNSDSSGKLKLVYKPKVDPSCQEWSCYNVGSFITNWFQGSTLTTDIGIDADADLTDRINGTTPNEMSSYRTPKSKPLSHSLLRGNGVPTPLSTQNFHMDI